MIKRNGSIAQAIFCSILLFANYSPAQTKQGPAGPAQSEPLVRARQSAWLSALKAIAKTEGIALVFDVNIEHRAPTEYKTKLGRAGLDLLAALTGRKRAEVEGIQVFVRDLNATLKTYSSHVAEFLDFVDSLPEELLNRMTGDGLPISLVPESQHPFLRSVLTQHSTTGPGLALSNWDKTILRLKPLAGYEFTNRATGKKTVSVLPRKSENLPNTKEDVERALKGSRALDQTAPLPLNEAGELKFDAGEIITIEEFMNRAEECFQTKYLLDSRLFNDLVFVSGSFSQKAFEESLLVLTKIPPATIVQRDNRTSAEAVKALIEGKLNNLLESDMNQYTDVRLTLGDFAKGISLGFGDLAKGNSMSMELMSVPGNGLSPTTQVRLRPGFSLSVRTLSTTIDANGREQFNWLGGVPLAMLSTK